MRLDKIYWQMLALFTRQNLLWALSKIAWRQIVNFVQKGRRVRKNYHNGGIWQSGVLTFLYKRSSCEGCLQLKFISRSSSIKGQLPSTVVFHQGLSSINGCLPLKDVFHERSSSIKGCLPSNIVFHKRSSSIKGRLPSKIVFHQRSSSIKSRLPSEVVFHQMCLPFLYQERSRMFPYHPPFLKPNHKLTVTNRRTKTLRGVRASALPKNRHQSYNFDY